jgi:hypothetical protein
MHCGMAAKSAAMPERSKLIKRTKRRHGTLQARSGVFTKEIRQY